MGDILQANIEDMPGMSFDCECGRKHSVDIGKLVIGSDNLDEIVEGLSAFRGEKLLVLMDKNTYGAFGEIVVKRLLDYGFQLKSFMFDTGDRMLLPDERSIGRALLEVEPDTTFILVAGSGVLSDIARIVSYRTGKRFAIVATAPSMDGYTSVGSSLIVGNTKTTIYSHYPCAIFADTSVMRNAPMIMIRAGFGDVIGKLTALADWNLTRIINNEYYCGTIAKLVQKGVGKCMESAEGLAARDERSIRCLIDALILTGLSIGLAGVSRPASGTEHQLAHYWEIKAVEKGEEHPLHGNSVGVGTVVTAMLYELASGILPEGIDYPKADFVKSLLEKVGAFTNPRDLGISRELFVESMMNAMNMKDKYTVLRYCAQKGKLEEFTDIITRELYN
ncbi:MAG: sn-glycerol-1-phosphate dehydrogenase [Clostridiaceae bacterium]|nr:sn-glycerol-1-phosphate dehydrogenase [Clostridiaceae bacterium]